MRIVEINFFFELSKLQDVKKAKLSGKVEPDHVDDLDGHHAFAIIYHVWYGIFSCELYACCRIPYNDVIFLWSINKYPKQLFFYYLISIILYLFGYNTENMRTEK